MLCRTDNFAMRSPLCFKVKPSPVPKQGQPSRFYFLGKTLKLYKDLQLICLMPDVCDILNNV